MGTKWEILSILRYFCTNIYSHIDVQAAKAVLKVNADKTKELRVSINNINTLLRNDTAIVDFD